MMYDVIFVNEVTDDQVEELACTFSKNTIARKMKQYGIM
jgi:hypothetical protein